MKKKETTMKKMLRMALAAGIGLYAALVVPAPASAVPGQCMYTPWGGYCDEYPWSDGSFYHCESAMGFSNCYQACLDGNGRPFPTDINLNTPC